jgi:tetratricopeptide (TPR) repeat protein
VKCQALIVSFIAVSLTLPGEGVWAQAPAQKDAKAKPSPADELAQKAVLEAQKDNLEEALRLFREAYRIDHSPRWLYNLGVLHDRLGECDDAAFFYRAALWAKPSGVLPQDRDPVDNRLGVLEDECHFKKRHATEADRHTRAARYMGFKMCFLAEQILTGIATPAEKKQLEDCKAKEKTPEAKEKAPEAKK